MSFRAVLDLKTMSICMTSPKDSGRGTLVVFFFDLSTVACIPRSWIGSVSREEIEKLFLHVSRRIGINLDIFLNPNERRSWSYVKLVSCAHEENGRSKMRSGGRLDTLSISVRILWRNEFAFLVMRWEWPRRKCCYCISWWMSVDERLMVLSWLLCLEKTMDQ